ncbi:hypothetical protein [Bradyrhizobium sp. sBnM-33]|uniref:hypothetical protein n=1 Tax=Bradyrhizobium sp. sBnM-33 TaxID=2831780 RepID=UPI001BCFDE3A|nr:hypothetical protein [Bradyrhizobium sp. sBnM-33]WOH48871.1 hypothetical protein RX328_32990 [Bradyrhizobium sp. sBnM-33]
MPLVVVVHPILAYRYRRMGDRDRVYRCLFVALTTTAVAIVYIGIKNRFGLEGLHPVGGEADLISTYGFNQSILMIEDVVSSFFTFFYTTISTYLPPQLLSFSLSSWLYGPDEVVRLQEGYHPQATHLTHYNHLFLWRYYAGFFLALFLTAYVRVIRASFQQADVHYVILFVLLTATLIGSPTHLIIKWRPMHAAPLLGYQCFMSIIGFTLLLCYLIHLKMRRVQGWRSVGLALALIANFGYCAYARPSLLSHMSHEVFLGAYPDPRINLDN